MGAIGLYTCVDRLENRRLNRLVRENIELATDGHGFRRHGCTATNVV